MSEDQQKNDGGAVLAQHIKAALADHPHAEVRVNPVVQAAIPEHIAKNLMEFLRRVQSTGVEAIAWVEAYSYVQQFANLQPPAAAPQPGVPFTGLPPK